MTSNKLDEPTMTIRTLFDPSREIDRTIEKVISYGASQENRLKTEISEYWVTDSIEEQLGKLLEKMQLAMEAGGENEIGVWVSGFYGSGKSSFTKYFGLSFDSSVSVEGVPFIKHLQNRLRTAQVKALLPSVVSKFPSAVVMLDLASEMLAGATKEDVSTVLYYKVLQWAGYSRNLKVAALERKLEKDGRYDEFKEKIQAALPDLTWKELQNDPLIVDGLVPQAAHDMYPELFPTPTSFSSNIEDFFKFENERVKEMIDLVREKSGCDHIIFIIDEVGQYIAASDNLILNLDGLAKNLKGIGDGKVWIITTAQQTLTEDDPRAALNSDKLYKLKDRFPIQIDLIADDIKEICYRRLLGKSPQGSEQLSRLFDEHGQALRFNTKLQDAKYYDSDFTKEDFINLYPFLPAHFDILLNLLGNLAKSTGGIGLRSSIKVIQDILIEQEGNRTPAADQPIGWLATTVTMFDSLDKDIRRASPHTHHAVMTTLIRCHGSRVKEEVAKSIAVLQVLNNLPVTVKNIAALMHPSVAHSSRFDEVQSAVQEMLNDPLIPLGEKDGTLHFLSEKLREIEEERGKIALRSLEMRRIFSEALKETFDPLPKVTIHSTLSVTAGFKLQSGSSASSLAGEREPVQMILHFVNPAHYDTEKTQLTQESTGRTCQNNIYLLTREVDALNNIVGEIYRCEEIVSKYRNDPDKEVKEYCTNQATRAETLKRSQLIPQLTQALSHGSFVFRGKITAVSALDQNLHEAAKRILADAAGEIFNRYSEAPVRVDTSLAEKFLRTATNLSAITSAIDPLNLIEISGGQPRFNSAQKAVVSIRDFIERNGTVDGKRLSSYFKEPPFGWSPDTLRYILAAMLVFGEIKLKISGREVTTTGQQAIDALKTNRSFDNVGVALRDERPSNETLMRAAARLTDLIGDSVLPLEQEISKVTAKHLPVFQHEYAPLAERLSALSAAGADRVRTMNQTIADVLLTDASDASQRFGAEESVLYDSLKWARELKRALDAGLETTVQELQTHRREIESLPGTGIPGELRDSLAEQLELVSQRLAQESFYQNSADLNSSLTSIKARVKQSVDALAEQQRSRLRQGVGDLQLLPEWQELTQEEQDNSTAELESMQTEVPSTISGLKQLLARDYDLTTRLSELKESIRQNGQERIRQRLEEERSKAPTGDPGKLRRSIPISLKLTTNEQLDELIRLLHEIRSQSSLYAEIELTFDIQE